MKRRFSGEVFKKDLYKSLIRGSEETWVIINNVV